jgi:hypothetical protein
MIGESSKSKVEAAVARKVEPHQVSAIGCYETSATEQRRVDQILYYLNCSSHQDQPTKGNWDVEFEKNLDAATTAMHCRSPLKELTGDI